MQALSIKPLKITIPGEYYDSQIYDGRLYLWKSDGSILTLNWNRLIENIAVHEDLNIVLKFALLCGDNLYGNLLFQDEVIKMLILEKFKKLAKISIEISSSDLTQISIGEQDNPLPFPHADSVIHYKTVYVGSQSGVSSSDCINISRNQLSINTIANKICDLPVLSLSASNMTLALAAGSEGLFDYYLKQQNSSQKSPEPHCITKQHSSFVRWLYPSIFSSSYFNEGCFADFRVSKKRKSETEQNNKLYQETPSQLAFSIDDFSVENTLSISSLERGKKQIVNREFQKLVSANEIFVNTQDNESSLFTWGTSDKICLVKENHIELVKCNPTAKKEQDKFISLNSVNTQEIIKNNTISLNSVNTQEIIKNNIISADSSFFGIVLEQENGLSVITSSLEYIYLPGEPVNWRVFPNSRNYINQLHVIYEDCLHIYSFNHDFFVDQRNKQIGISFRVK